MTNANSIQHQAWASGTAADEFFERNQKSLVADNPPSRSIIFYSRYINPGDKVLEIGCANGHALEQLRRLTGCHAYGIDPSPKAINHGYEAYPELNLLVGTADSLEYPDEFFDVVLFGYCLYLVDRKLLMRVVAESDRVLTNKFGKLMITDFDPTVPHRRAFKHQEGVWSYKMQYQNLWLANPNYTLAEKISFSHSGEIFHQDPNERVASWILVKNNTTFNLNPNEP